MNTNNLEVLSEIVGRLGHSEIVRQLARVEFINNLAWVSVFSCLLVLTVVGGCYCHRQVNKSHPEDRRDYLILLWSACGVLTILFATWIVCHAVTAWQFSKYPEVMVLRDLAGRLRR